MSTRSARALMRQLLPVCAGVICREIFAVQIINRDWIAAFDLRLPYRAGFQLVDTEQCEVRHSPPAGFR